MLMAEADGSNDKRASFSAILKLVGGPLLSLTDAIPDELSAILTLPWDYFMFARQNEAARAADATA
jgi:hypothetical protein